VEALNFLKTGNLISLSEQNLIDCSSSYGNNGCSRGLMDSAFQYIIDNKGIDTEQTYPYFGIQSSCRFQSQWVGATINSYYILPYGNEITLTSAINNRTISVAVDASHISFQLYSAGVYYEPQCSSTALTRGMLVIGYGSTNTADYYIVKSSLGTSWGMSGYIWMSRNKNNNCGIASVASYPL